MAKGHRRTWWSRGTSTLAAGLATSVVVAALIPVAGTALALTSSTGTAAVSDSGNLLSGDQATFDGTTGGWVGSNADLSPGSDSTSLQVGATTASSVSAWSALPPSGTPTPAAPGNKYTGEATVEATDPTQTIGLALAFFDSSGNGLAAVWGQAVTPGASGTSTWTTLPEVAAIAPAGTASVVLGVMAWSDGLGLDFLVQSPVLTTLTGPAVAPSVVGPLHTSANQIVQANGQPVTLRGVVMPGLEQSGTLAGAVGVTQQAVIEAKAWGANFVRVPLGEQFWLSSNCDYVSSYVKTVDQVVNWITSLGMVALLDLHTNTVGGCQPGTEHNMADATQSPKFWTAVAARYGTVKSPEYNPLVAFDLYNEPHNLSDAVWLNGGKTTDYFGGQTYQAAGMQQLYNSVRAAGSQNIVFISGNNWASTPPTTLVKGSNIAYAVHYYTCPSIPLSSCTNPNPYDPSQDLNQWIGLSGTAPVVVAEFGWPGQADGTYLANVIAYASSHGWGWSVYAWEDRQYPTPWDLSSSWLSDGTAEPSPSGVPVLLGLSEAT